MNEWTGETTGYKPDFSLCFSKVQNTLECGAYTEDHMIWCPRLSQVIDLGWLVSSQDSA